MNITAPDKLYVETTTRCNLRCDKCIKQIENNGIIEGDMGLDTFGNILPGLSGVNQLILNGIGEPLLHPELEKMIGAARKFMPGGSAIGFQTNGLLMTPDRGESLVEAGLTTVCFSVDSLVESGVNGSCTALPSARPVEEGIRSLQAAAARSGRRMSYGLEVVVSRTNIAELPEMVTWAGELGVDYLLVSHLFPYDRDMAGQSLFSPNSESAFDLFSKYQTRAERLGVDLCPGDKAYLNFSRTPEQNKTVELLKEMRREASAKNIRMHGESLLAHEPEQALHTESMFSRARDIAKQNGIDLWLPPLAAHDLRECPFMAQNAAFVSFEGEVMPCHFLWHTYPCMAGTETIEVQKRSFGNISDRDLGAIWLDDQYIRFREEAARGDYSPCWNCSQGPCDDLVIGNLLEVDDCYGSQVPCGHCLWSLGGLKCL